MIDCYEDIFSTINPSLIYTAESIPTHEFTTLANEEYIGCKCTLKCDVECPCYAKTGGLYKNGVLTRIEEKPLYECNSNCKCARDCGLKSVQNGPLNNLKVTTNAAKGHGLFTERPVGCGRFICEYAGEIITLEEAETRFKSYKASGLCNYIFWLCEHFGEAKITTVVDPTCIGNIGRFINHSCDPNCDLLPVRIDNLIPKLCVFTKRELKEGEEITFDYGANESGLLSDESNKITCHCNASNCKKSLPYHKV